MRSQELKDALGMPDNAPPSWLINMQERKHQCTVCYLPACILRGFPIDWRSDIATPAVAYGSRTGGSTRAGLFRTPISGGV
ncbi:hypothetical protein DCAR_0934528 [Daucus carota subsp. sativus]|uniref:PSP proline-rich domain-containing protein n=1 Tax=Daucus carota subsp. sativus TaxID=79200 RepID=A0A161WTP5_DAUCS|nr:hypothetical protein DCAR_0625687 [Daucus carota subsp. sativus]WOH14998.1 hypothetical protein DCAR_0934528 [Daucus carota subsp. sativus]